MCFNIDSCFRLLIVVMIQGCIDSGAAGAKEGANVTEGGDEAESKVCVCWDYLLA